MESDSKAEQPAKAIPSGKKTKKCPKCRELIDASATVCPLCHSKLGITAPAGCCLIFIAVAMGLLGLSLINSSKTSTPGSPATSVGQSGQTLTAIVGEDLRVGDVRWKVLAVTDRGQVLRAKESRYRAIAKPKTTTGKFVLVRFEVENLGTEMKTITDLTVVDDKGREYVSSSGTDEWVPENESLYILASLNPGVPKAYSAIYEVSADAKGLKLEVGELTLFGTKKGYIELGL